MKQEVDELFEAIRYKRYAVSYVYWVNDKEQLHREDGPAVEYANGTKEWCINGKLHRENGPAVEYANGTKQWWVNGTFIRSE